MVRFPVHGARSAAVLVFTCLFSLASGMGGDSWWVWQPSKIGSMKVSTRVKSTNPETLYWHVQTLKAGPAAKLPRMAFSAPVADVACPVVPVIRLEGGAAVLEDAEARAAIETAVTDTAAKLKPPMVQLDYDCPARLLPAYAQWLRGLRERMLPVRLSITALAGWPPFDAGTWTGAVDEMVPMFYDMEPDKPEEMAAGRFRGLADAREAGSLIAAWKNCPVTWRCGLANFTRASRIRADGLLAGHLRAWNPDTFLFDSDFGEARAAGPGAWQMAVLHASGAASVKWEAGDSLIVRFPALAEIAGMERAARESGAAGAVWFQLPSGIGSDAWSPQHLASRTAPGEWSGQLRRENGRLVLKGDGERDLPAQWQSASRGWVLEVSAPAAWFRDSSPGGFFSIECADDEGAVVSMARASCIRWRFGALPAGKVLQTGPLTVAPSADASQLRWRVCGPGLAEKWQAIP